ncbi:MAG: argininosuccinate lyase [Caulobacterales bacterium]|nr:argininosuccinate lyase [Caulobacterales bacterium]
MWGGRFATKPSDALQAINASINVDKKMWREDIDGSLAHSKMLAHCNIISMSDCELIHSGLNKIAEQIENGEFNFSVELEDIHLNIEARLTENIGEAGKRLHTGRSRNDQVANDFKLWTRRALQSTIKQIEELQKTILQRSEQHFDWIMPGFTHLQTAQPVTLGHHLLAYVEMLARDKKRMQNAIDNASEAVLGSSALAGTPFPINREMTAHELGFARPNANSMDGVGSRDFALEALGALSIAAVNLSRLADEIVLWTSAQFGFARLSDDWSTGSSIMPQKRNPDAAELIRAKAARISANNQALLMILKALPLTYSKDLQEDKTLTFGAFEDFWLCLVSTIGMMEKIKFNRENMLKAARFGYSTATDLADWLVRNHQIPFREAHHIVGSVVKYAEQNNINELCEMPLHAMQEIDKRISQDAINLLSVEASVNSRTSFGGSAPQNVLQQIKHWKEILHEA